MSRLVLDTVERTAAAYITTLLGLLLADGFDVTNVGALKAAAIAAIPAALSVAKAAIGARFGDPESAAWLPDERHQGGSVAGHGARHRREDGAA